MGTWKSYPVYQDGKLTCIHIKTIHKRAGEAPDELVICTVWVKAFPWQRKQKLPTEEEAIEFARKIIEMNNK